MALLYPTDQEIAKILSDEAKKLAIPFFRSYDPAGVGDQHGNRRIYPIFGNVKPTRENSKALDSGIQRQGIYTMTFKIGDGSNFMKFINSLKPVVTNESIILKNRLLRGTFTLKTNKKPAMNKNRNKRYEIDFDSLELTEAEKTSLLLKILDERGLKLQDEEELQVNRENADEMSTRFVQEVKQLPLKGQNNCASLFLDKLSDERKLKAEHAQNVANETIETYNDANKDLSDLVLRVR